MGTATASRRARAADEALPIIYGDRCRAFWGLRDVKSRGSAEFGTGGAAPQNVPLSSSPALSGPTTGVNRAWMLGGREGLGLPSLESPRSALSRWL
jgi:hypothetical protein